MLLCMDVRRRNGNVVMAWSKVMVVRECCYGMEVRGRWKRSVVMAWMLGDGGMGVLLWHAVR